MAKLLQNRINYEAEMYNDVIQGSFHDTYRNMTKKALTSLRSVTHFMSIFIFSISADPYFDWSVLSAADAVDTNDDIMRQYCPSPHPLPPGLLFQCVNMISVW